ncbi:MAG: glutamyl-tRNA reductase [Persicimonas sp.]
MSTTRTLRAFSFSHKDTSLEVRDALAFSAEQAREFTVRAHRALDSEGAVISTCNRTEFYLFGPHGEGDWGRVRACIDQIKDLSHDNIPTPKKFEGNDAARHLFRVAASLESLALGENQILGQVKDAHECMLRESVKTPTLDQLFQYAVRCGKQVRTDTGLCEGTVSVSSVAVQLAEKIFGDFDDRRVLIVGAGETAEKAALHFSSAGASAFTVVNRSAERGRAFAHQFDGEYRPLDELTEAATEADVVLVATGAGDYLLTHRQVKQIMKQRHHKAIFLIDVSNPRNIDPEAGEVGGVYLYNMDDLQAVVADNLDARRDEIPDAEKIVDYFVDRWDNWRQSLQVTPTIANLAQHFEAMREAELDRHEGQLDEAERAMLEAFSKGLIKKLLHDPIMYLRSSAQENSLSSEDLKLVRSLYNLQEFEDGDQDD